jgi:hypothetical protein
MRHQSEHQKIETSRCTTMECAKAGEWVGTAAREGRGRRSREPRRRSAVERRCRRSAETVSSSDGESSSSGGLEGRAIVQIPWTAWARAVLPAPVRGGVRRTSGCGKGVKILDLWYTLADILIRPGSASPFEGIVGKIFDILDGREWAGHNIRLGVIENIVNEY